jgi:hypothetical protein
MFARHKQEKQEGKDHHDRTVGDGATGWLCMLSEGVDRPPPK